MEWMKKKGGGKCVLLFVNFQGESRETKEQLNGKIAGSRALGTREKEKTLGWRFSVLPAQQSPRGACMSAGAQTARQTSYPSLWGGAQASVFWKLPPGCSALKPKTGGSTCFRDLKELLTQPAPGGKESGTWVDGLVSPLRLAGREQHGRCRQDTLGWRGHVGEGSSVSREVGAR